MKHIPVLLKEIIMLLDPRPGETAVDGTVNGGGHAQEFIKCINPNGTFVGVDWDRQLINQLQRTMTINNDNDKAVKIILEAGNYKDMGVILKKNNIGGVDAILLDLGFSTEHLEGEKGFSFQKDDPLIMTYSDQMAPAYQVLKQLSEYDLAKVIKTYGEERFSMRIARAIKEYLRGSTIVTSKGLSEAIWNVVPSSYRQGRIHPATRTFQAIRIYVNHELENLEEFLKQCLNLLNPNGRLAIISFHSLEDRIVKNYFRDFKKNNQAEVLTKKPIVASDEETRTNPRARSAKLRVIRKILDH